ncbi:MAG: substrate-binding domain-containing protein [Coriobacteriales bacterium]
MENLPPAPARITDIEQLAAVADPMRGSLLRMLMARPATLTQLASELGTYPSRVRYHVKRLEEVGLVQLVRCAKTRTSVEKYYEATASAYVAHIMLIPERVESEPVVVVHCDAAVEALVEAVRSESNSADYATVFTGSLDGLVALRQGLAVVAGCHLFDPAAEEYNLPYVQHLFPGRKMAMITVADREQGLVVRPGNPLRLTSLADLAEPGVRMVNRELGSGTRTWFDSEIARCGVDAAGLDGYESVADTHAGVAEAVLKGSADAGIAPRGAADAAGLGFVPLFVERYELVMDESRLQDERVARLIDTLTSGAFQRRFAELGGYDPVRAGEERTTA